jgi:uncharacterized membrane protein
VKLYLDDEQAWYVAVLGAVILFAASLLAIDFLCYFM